jgi:hypothetical protein
MLCLIATLITGTRYILEYLEWLQYIQFIWFYYKSEQKKQCTYNVISSRVA